MQPQGAAAPVQKELHTAQGVLSYTLVCKKVRNLNLRVRADGTVAISVPARTPQSRIDAFLKSRAAWVFKARAQMLARPPAAPCRYTREEALRLFAPLCAAAFPLFSDLLGGRPPLLKAREMKSRWGSCSLKTRTITLNTRLAEQPLPAQEYVVLHEFVHFLFPNHGAGFHAEMARLMPDYRHRRRLLRPEP